MSPENKLTPIELRGTETPLELERLSYANIISNMAYMLRHDSLTGLLKREALINEIDELVAADKPVGVAILDMDAFKKVNDNLGHPRADVLLEGFSEKINVSFRREGDMVSHERMITPEQEGQKLPVKAGRFGGDEFILVFDLSDREEPDGLTPAQRMDSNYTYLRKVLDEFEQEQDEEIQKLGYGLSIGVAVRQAGGNEVAADLIRTADLRMLENKKERGAPER